MEQNQPEKRYGLFTAICMVVGIVIGSGVFFKAQDILNYTGGNMLLGTLAWVIGGLVMIVCAFNFANFATKHARVNGIVDYAEAIVGERYAYMTGWFLSTIYYPAMTAVLAWVSARYTLVIRNPSADVTGGLCMALAAFYLVVLYGVNLLAPRLAGRFQVSATVIKLIPLLLLIFVGATVGLVSGSTVEAFSDSVPPSGAGEAHFSDVFAGIAAATFAYDGWICATSINAELKNAKRNLPIALVVGTSLIMVIYITYFVGLTGGASVDALRTDGATVAFRNLFGSVGGTVLNVFVAISCLGTLNGLTIANARSIYSIAVRGHGIAPRLCARLDDDTKTPLASGFLSLVITAFWFFYFYAANLTEPLFGVFSFDSSELPIITIYAIYIPIFFCFLVKEGRKSIFKNGVMPALAIVAALFMVFVAFYAHGIAKYQAAAAVGEFSFPVLFYLIVFAVIMVIGAFFYRPHGKGRENGTAGGNNRE